MGESDLIEKGGTVLRELRYIDPHGEYGGKPALSDRQSAQIFRRAAVFLLRAQATKAKSSGPMLADEFIRAFAAEHSLSIEED